MRLDVNRRELIMFVSAATVWPLQAARAQQSENLARIGFLPLGSPSNQHDLSYVEAFRKGLIENGLIEGRNIILDVVWVANDSEYDQAAIELVRRGATVLVPVASSASAACKRQTSTIPIVFINVGNPVGIGIVESLSHPGGNVTGFADLTVELSGKLLEFARELTPAGKPIGYLWYDKWVDGQSRLLATELAAKASGMALQARAISDVVELNSVSTPEQKCIGLPEQKYINDASQKAPETGVFCSGIRLGSDYLPAAYPSSHGVSGACSD